MRRLCIVPVPEEQLPVELPEVEDYAPHGRSPLAAAEDWSPPEGSPLRRPRPRETDTMDTFVDSSWDFLLLHLDPRTRQRLGFHAAAEHWMPVDQYIGGVEHASCT